MLWALQQINCGHFAAQLNCDSMGRAALIPLPQWRKFLFFRN